MKILVKDVAAHDAHLHLQAVPEAMPAAVKVLTAWGFRYESFLVWQKTPTGYGRYWRESHEVLLLGVRGHLGFRDTSLPSWVEDGRSSCAQRNGAVRAMIERASPAPYLDLVGVVPSSGWTLATAKG
jgi:hypothetical protein